MHVMAKKRTTYAHHGRFLGRTVGEGGIDTDIRTKREIFEIEEGPEDEDELSTNHYYLVFELYDGKPLSLSEMGF